MESANDSGGARCREPVRSAQNPGRRETAREHLGLRLAGSASATHQARRPVLERRPPAAALRNAATQNRRARRSPRDLDARPCWRMREAVKACEPDTRFVGVSAKLGRKQGGLSTNCVTALQNRVAALLASGASSTRARLLIAHPWVVAVA